MKRLISLLLVIALFFPVIATDLSKVKFQYLNVDNGLSQGVIEDIYQDRQGFMWFATRDGLNRYDGMEFTIFRNDRNDPNSLVSSFVSSIGEDINGKIWIGSNGLNVYDPVLNKMSRIKTNPDDPDAYRGGGRVYSITTDNDSTLWFSTGNGLVHYLPEENRYRTYLPDSSKPGSLGSSIVYSICITRNNRLFVATSNDEIFEFDRKKEYFRALSYRMAYFGNNTNKFIQEDSQGRLYITSEFSALHIYDPVSGTSRLIDRMPGELNAVSIKTRVLPVAHDEIWIGTDGGGINIYNPVDGSMRYLTADSRIENSLSGNAIFKIYQDRDRNIWIGHYGSGVSVWKVNKEKFTSFKHNPFNEFSINKEVVTAIFEDSKGRIWIGQDGGGLSLFDESNKKFEHIRHRENDPSSITTDIILTINEDPEGNLLLGTYMGGFMVFDPDRRRVIKSFNTSSGIPANHIWMIYRDRTNRYWVTFLGAGYGQYDPVSKTFQLTGINGPLICANVIMNVSEDDSGRIWFGTETQGICVLDMKKKEIKSYVHDENIKNSLSYNDVKSIIFMGDDAWIATNGGGLNRLNLKTDSFKVYSIENGLSSNALMGMLQDKGGNLWISSTRGIMKFDPSTEEVEVYDKSQGIQGNEFKYNAQCLLRDGRMMFGGINGLTVFHPDSIRGSNIIPSVVFTDLKVLNHSVVPGVKGSPLKSHINFTPYLKLNHKQSVFTIEYASLDYNSPEKNMYQYKLEGFDEDWVDAGNRRFVTYTNLDAGKYVFLLKGSNSDGIWNETPRRIIIRVRPPWYFTRVSIIIFIIALIAGIIYYIRQREKQSVQDKLILEQKIEEAQSELKSKTRKVEEHEEEIKRRTEEEKDYRFFTEGITRLSEVISKKRRNLEDLSTSVISDLVRYVDASAGGIFVLDDNDPMHSVLRATGEFCISSEQHVNYAFEIGEGNIGSCFKEQQTLMADNLPDGYIMMKSGLGCISLHHAVFVPIMQDNICVGVLEVASAEKLSDNKVKFIEKIAESLASIIAIIKANDKASQMIEQNNAQAEELRAQEEEMRQNMEELLATQEESERREKKLLADLEEKNEKIKELLSRKG